VDLDYSDNAGGSWASIETGESNDGAYFWDISGLSDGTNYLVRVIVTDTSGLFDSDTSDAVFSIDNPDDPTVTVTYPNGGETLSDSVMVTWTATDPDVGDSALLVVDLDYSDNGGGSWESINTGEVNDGVYSWDISGLLDGSGYLVRVTVTDTSGLFDSDTSDAVFSIDNPDDPTVTVTYPNGGETLSDSVMVIWTATDPDVGDSALLVVDLDYSDNAGGSWTSIETGESNDGAYFWDISGLSDGSDYLVRVIVTDTTGRSDLDVSDGTFSVDNPDAPTVSVTYPNGGETLSDSVMVTWTATDPDVGDSALLVVDLDYSDNAGGSWESINTGEVNDGVYSWDISGLSDGSGYLLRVTVTDTSGLFDSDTSDAIFTIDNPDAPSVTVIYPNGAETLSDSAVITWLATDPDVGDSALLVVDLDYSDNGGGSWMPISTGESNDGSHFWDVSELSDGTNYLVRVTVTDTTGLFDVDTSDAVFIIDNPEPPAAISDLTVVLTDGSIRLSWTAITEDTLGMPIVVEYYNVYRNVDPYFSSGPADSIGSTTGTFYLDPTPALKDTSVNHYYLVQAVSLQRRKSADSNRVGEFDRNMTDIEPSGPPKNRR